MLQVRPLSAKDVVAELPTEVYGPPLVVEREDLDPAVDALESVLAELR